MIKGPRDISIRSRLWFAASGSFHVLYQLPDLFQGRLDLDHMSGDPDVAGLGTNRVRLAAHLLDQEFELPPRAVIFGPDDRFELLQVAVQAAHFLGNVRPLGE